MGELRAFDRHTAIVDYLRLYERASTRQLSRHFGVSEVTIRSDLTSLERDGWLVRRHGGAELARTDQGEQLFAERHRAHRLEKAEIARAAAELVAPDTTILLDASTTTYQLALEIRDRRNLTIITNNLPAATLLSENPSLEVILIGGQIRGGVGSVVGVLAEEMLAKLHAARGFFGAAGLTLDRGLT
ncbi:MAG: DeoR/GlpR family DNA-binding transcription regulator, partial [Caldilinea sp.]